MTMQFDKDQIQLGLSVKTQFKYLNSLKQKVKKNIEYVNYAIISV